MSIAFVPPITPSFPTSKDVKWRVLTAQFGDGYNQRVTDGLSPRQEIWNLEWINVTDAEYAAITGVIESAQGVDSLNWTTPDGNNLNFVVGAYKAEKTQANVNHITVTFTQDLNGSNG